MVADSEICKFYDEQNVFVTGGTGFMGKILIEKLLRSTNVATIFVLIRKKKGKNIETRLDDIFDNTIFNVLKKEQPKFRHRVVPVSGDCMITSLGLTISDRQRLLTEVNIVFHVAATVRFDENLKISYDVNVNATKDVVELCRQMNNLKAMMHVSTAYSNCHLSRIKEVFYDYDVNYESVGILLQKTSQSEAEKLTSRLIGNWPNTYTFTKALAEALIRDTGTNLPIGVFRPSIVVSTYKEPIEGWIDNMYGPTGGVAAAGAGLIRVVPCNPDLNAEIVPVDTCVAALIAAAWDVANRKQKNQLDIPIYNYVSSVENAVKWREFHSLGYMGALEYPLSKAVWTIKFIAVSSIRMYLFLRIILHLLPALLFDTASIFGLHAPVLLATYSKIHKFLDAIMHFSINSWSFENDNTVALWEKLNQTDQKLFPFSVTTISWLTYFRNYFKGVRVHLLGDPLSTVEDAKRRKRRFDIVHDSLKFLVYFLFIGFIWLLLSGGLLYIFRKSVTNYFTNCTL